MSIKTFLYSALEVFFFITIFQLLLLWLLMLFRYFVDEIYSFAYLLSGIYARLVSQLCITIICLQGRYIWYIWIRWHMCTLYRYRCIYLNKLTWLVFWVKTSNQIKRFLGPNIPRSFERKGKQKTKKIHHKGKLNKLIIFYVKK